MRFIQVGVGGFGTNWVRCLMENRNATLVALVDVKPDALAKACRIGGYDETICFRTLHDALQNVEADAVVCATPPDCHRKPVIEAMKAGLDVISEKPMAHGPADSKAILTAARNTRRACVVSQNYRYKPVPLTLAGLVRRGRIGEIGQVKIDFYMGHDFGGGFRHEMDFPLLIDMSIHHFDLIRFITGLNAVSVRGEAWNPPWSNYKGQCSSSLAFQMENGARVIYNASWCAKGQFCNWDGNWQIEGGKGSITYRDEQITLHAVPGLYKPTEARTIPVKGPRLTGQQFVLNDFIKAVTQGRRPCTDVYDNIQSVAMVFSAVKAVRTGRRVPVMGKALREIIELPAMCAGRKHRR